MAGAKKDVKEECARRLELEDRSRNEQQKAILLQELAKLHSGERDRLVDTATGLRKESARIRQNSRKLRKRAA